LKIARRLQPLPRATGREQAKAEFDERALKAEVDRLGKELPVPVASGEGQLQTALDTAKTSAENIISDLDAEIEQLDKAIADRKQLKKPLKEITHLKPDTDLIRLRNEVAEKRKRRDALKAEYKKIFPDSKKKKILSDAKRLKMAEAMLDRQITAIQDDLAAGRLGPREHSPPLTSEAREAKQSILALWKEVREEARRASPEYQAQQELNRIDRYLKAKERQLAFWENRLDEARQGKVPKKRKPPPENEAILAKQLDIDKAKYEALALIERNKRATWNAGQWIGHGLNEVTSLIPKSLMLGLEWSFFKRQGFFYARSAPIKAFAAAVDAIKSTFSQRIALASMENIANRPNAMEYHQGGIDFTTAHGPKAKLEEMFKSSFIRWLENTEGILWLPLRTYAKLYAAFERGNRTFANTMKADLYDIEKRDTLAAREFFGDSTEWTKEDIKETARSANIFSGRGTGLRGSNPWMEWFFLARRWAWSRIQTDFVVPFQLMTPAQIGQWNADRGMRVAMAKLYLRTLLGHAAKMATMYWIYTLVAGDDEDKKPTIEWDLRSSDALALKMGETRIKDEGGTMPAVVLAARVATGKMKTSSGEIKSIYGEDVQYGGRTAADFIINYGRYKLGTGPSGILEWASGRDAVGRTVTKTESVTQRITPLTLREIAEAERELGVELGTIVALEAFFGATVSTYGPKTDARRERRERERRRWMRNVLKSVRQ
jgi:hypothetical protein